MRARFWRNVMLIALAHVALLVLLLRWAGETKAARPPEIKWLSGGAQPESEEASDTEEADASESPPDPAETMSPAESEIVLPSPTAKPRPSSTPRPSVTPKSTVKKKPKPSATVAKKKNDAPKKENVAKKDTARAAANGQTKTSTGGSGEKMSGSGKSDTAAANYYGNMLHDRFYHAWEQPQTVVASGVKLSTTARIRIEKDGRVSDFKIVKPSGNVLVDESVQSVSRKVTQVDALPAGIGIEGHYDVNINFALNSE